MTASASTDACQPNQNDDGRSSRRSRALRTLAATGVAVGLLHAGVANAAITPSNDAPTVAGAATDSLAAGQATGAEFTEVPPTAADVNPAGVSDSSLAGFPSSGPSNAILSSGDVLFADDPNDSESTGVDNGGGGGGHGDSVLDLVTLRIDLSVPETANCFSMDFRFLSDEFPEFVGSTVNDAFVAELDASTFSVDAAQEVVAPNNFAFDEDDNVISVNTAGFAAENSAGTTYDGATAFLQASTPITPGAHSIYLSIFDQGDSIYDSTVFVDRLRLRTLPAGSCIAGATDDTTPPDTIIDSAPHGTTADATPTFDFHSTEEPSTFECSIDTGTPSFGPCSGPGASHTPASALADGTYTFRVRATDASGNTDPTPAEETFTVQTIAPPVICPGAEQTYTGTKGKDEITGTKLNDLILGLAGHDLLDGAGGNDCVKGNAGDDTVRGGAGDDLVRGGDGADVHQGGNGNDKLGSADGVRDVVKCGPGDDDRAWVDELDHVKGCEKVTVVVVE